MNNGHLITIMSAMKGDYLGWGSGKLLWGQVDMIQAKSRSEKSQSDETAWGKSKEGKELGLCEEETVSVQKESKWKSSRERRWEGQAGPVSDELYLNWRLSILN